MSEEKKEVTSSLPVQRAFSHASGSISTMSDDELLKQVPNFMDPALVAKAKAQEGNVKFTRTPEEIAAARQQMSAGSAIDQMFAAGDRVYNKVQKLEATFVEDLKKPGMCLVKVGTSRFRVKKANLVKL